MNESLNQAAKKEIIKDIILKLHRGLSAIEAKERFEKEVGTITSTEIADIEQTLINEGLSPDEIKMFCNVHAMIFHSALEKVISQETSPSHPVYLFKLENREVEKLAVLLKEAVDKKREYGIPFFKERVGEILLKLRGVETHYERKEQLLFPFLEKHGFMGPSKVMWGKDNEIRDLLKKAHNELPGISSSEGLEAYIDKTLNPLIEEVRGMIFKEENILLPASLEKLNAGDWVEILRESDDIGYVFIEKPAETEMMLKDLHESLLEEVVLRDNTLSMPTGMIRLEELMPLLNTLPVDITFVDKEDRLRYFSESKSRLFRRTKSAIGRTVQNCHPPQSLEVVEKILTSFKEGKKDHYDFWLNYRDRLVYITFYAVRDKQGRYMGTVEVVQDITEIKKLEGERRLLDERD